ncbi:hypothetical protein KP509_09G027200 [Ceratopteris richardii]|uniref:Uncharacterized protein n=1 Tax=Ceratopteris richardii TaxID=49495 RepID=A0A8T2TZ07_CERRI|nr:hypothetical protein KP509_09G027200 [Ceratopteris richardii]
MASRTERAHLKYREGNYEEALQLYSEALAAAKLLQHKIALHSNRAACYLKLRNFRKAAEECSAVLELDGKHTGALMLRAQTLVAMKDYHSALFDVNRLLEINPSSDVYRNLQARLRTQVSLAPIPEGEDEMPEDSKTDTSASPTSTLPAAASSKDKDKGWEAIPKPKGHSRLDYSQWDAIAGGISDSDDDDDDDDEDNSPPQFKFKLRTIDLQSMNNS